VSLGVATIFRFQGAVLVLPSAGLGLAAIGIEAFVHARQAAQRVVPAQTIGRTLREGRRTAARRQRPGLSEGKNE